MCLILLTDVQQMDQEEKFCVTHPCVIKFALCLKTCRGNSRKEEFILGFIFGFQPVFPRRKNLVCTVMYGREN